MLIKNEKIHCRVPLRISFAGGGTDLPFYYEKYGGAVIGSTIDKFAYSTLTPHKFDKNKILVRSTDYDIETVLKIKAKFFDLEYDGKLDLAKAVLNVMKPKKLGFEMVTASDSAPGSGLGSSTSIVTSIVGALKSYMRLSLTSYEIAELAHKIERVNLSIKGGIQDQYACTFGGFYFIEFNKNKIIVNPLKIRSDIIHELESCLVLADTNISRDSSEIHSIQAKSINDKTIESLHDMKKHAYNMKTQLLKGDVEDFANELHESWLTKKKISDIISTKKIEKIYSNARKHGAISGKVLGAGGGGHMLFYVNLEKRRELEKNLIRSGCQIIPFCFENHGLQTWKVSEKGVKPG
ncbi:kinase galactokinase/mevalonate kinase [Candidatus Nitrosarchaeum limnium]|uniref:GHMP kinase, N-terminal domain protein n=1 Tax=Candidatus Nitrosarchaeum limnium BG20 TaxID=859192 RepID=S2EL13_9ARCH|nr:kinase galactokinase/mevalonate kinase [Candidatus Nitrosarchaeum limnium]EPA05322.1 GHMP kinase, N-terminal domain protein [Candidatus Nitrosarchaeum limnium BG20]